MAIDFQQTDTAATFGAIAACSGLSAGSVVDDVLCEDGGTAGTTEVTATHDGSGSGILRLFHFELDVAEGTSWDAGNWTVNLNVTTTSAQLIWQELYICRVDSGGTNQETIASATGLGLKLNTQFVSHTLAGSAQTPAAEDRVYVVVGCDNGQTMANTVGVTPSEVISSPFTAGASGQTLTGTAAFTPTLSFPQGALLPEQFLTGAAAFTPALVFGTGSVNQTISGTPFTPTLSFPTGKFAGAWSSTVSEFTFFTGSTFQVAPTFPQGNVDSGAQAQTLTGTAAFTPTLSFPQGTVQATNDLVGSTFTPTLSFPQGALGLANDLVGSTFTPTLAFPTGNVQATNDLVGSTFTPTLSFPQGSFGLANTLSGSVFTPTLSFPQGNVDAGAVLQTVTGVAAFTPTLSFPQGALLQEQFLTGSVFAPTLSFPTGNLAQDQTVTGTAFTPTLSFPTGTVTPGAVTLTGTVFTPSLNFGTGNVNLILTGAVFTPVLSFPQGQASPGTVTLVGTVFTPTLTFATGTVVSAPLARFTEGYTRGSGREAYTKGSGREATPRVGDYREGHRT